MHKLHTRLTHVLQTMAGVSLAACLATFSEANVEHDSWKVLEPGLELGEFRAPKTSALVGDGIVRVLRIDPKKFELRLMNASATQDRKGLTAREWCRRHDLVAAINSSMYQTDYLSSVSLMRTRTHTNNPRLSKDKAILAFDRTRPQVPLVKIIDVECDDYPTWKKRYGTLVQSIRMLSCKGRNVWKQQEQMWSTAAIGTDTEGRVLFIHMRSPMTTHDFINLLKQLPLNVSRAMYAEGGPEAQLYVRSGDFELEIMGSYESGFNENDENVQAWPVPNVVAIASREAARE